jgi:hypothetical protein
VSPYQPQNPPNPTQNFSNIIPDIVQQTTKTTSVFSVNRTDFRTPALLPTECEKQKTPNFKGRGRPMPTTDNHPGRPETTAKIG